MRFQNVCVFSELASPNSSFFHKIDLFSIIDIFYVFFYPPLKMFINPMNIIIVLRAEFEEAYSEKTELNDEEVKLKNLLKSTLCNAVQ